MYTLTLSQISDFLFKFCLGDVENGFVDIVWERESGMNGKSNINIYTLLGVRWIAGEKLCVAQGAPSGVMTWRDGVGQGREGKHVQ